MLVNDQPHLTNQVQHAQSQESTTPVKLFMIKIKLQPIVGKLVKKINFNKYVWAVDNKMLINTSEAPKLACFNFL